MLPRVKRQYDVVSGWMNHEDVDSIICATDSGREGELIFRLIYIMAGCTKPFQRLWISSMTVSYTHLDVYKRQEHRGAGRNWRKAQTAPQGVTLYIQTQNAARLCCRTGNATGRHSMGREAGAITKAKPPAQDVYKRQR